MGDKIKPRQTRHPKRISPLRTGGDRNIVPLRAGNGKSTWNPDWDREAAERAKQEEFWSDPCWREPA